MASTNERLIKELARKGLLKTKYITDAFFTIDRKDFVPPAFASEAFEDRPLPIPAGQTISQPSTVAFMMEQLQPQKGHRILDVGAGSGYTTAILGHIVGASGKVFGVELQVQLLDFCRMNLHKYPQLRVEIHKATKELGLSSHAPYDRILVSAYATDIPQALVDQLKVGGIMVVPVNTGIYTVTKTGDSGSKDDIEKEFHPGYVFVPLIEPGKETHRPNL